MKNGVTDTQPTWPLIPSSRQRTLPKGRNSQTHFSAATWVGRSSQPGLGLALGCVGRIQRSLADGQRVGWDLRPQALQTCRLGADGLPGTPQAASRLQAEAI